MSLIIKDSIMTLKHLLPLLFIAGQFVACDDDTSSGGSSAGEAMAGEAMAGEAMAGEAMAGEAMAGEAMAGEAMAGEAMAGEAMAGEAMAGEAMAGEPSTTYEFSNRFGEGSSISYSGQTARHALIAALKSYMGGLETSISMTGVFEEGLIVSILNKFFDCADDLCGGESITVSGPVEIDQVSISDISSGKDLVGKVAGNDPVGQHKDWSTEFVGWGDELYTPESLIRAWFEQVEQQAIAISNGEFTSTPSGEMIPRPDLSSTGLDYTQLVQKFLLGAIAFSQGADDYLDDTDEGKGLLSSNDVVVEGKTYTALEHNWDEGFGYFGAARDYLAYTDDEIASKDGRPEFQGAHDTNGDGVIDLVSEYNWGHSVNAAKRDRGHSTDLTQDAFDAFLQGRRLIASADGNLSEEQFAELKAYRDTAVLAWEKAIAATVIHYINDTIGDMDSGDEYDFETHAKHWSEMKGFALSFQFNPRSPVSDEVFAQVHGLFGIAPALPGDGNFDEYRTGLLEARSLLGAAYDFDDSDVETW